jgi:hypothetical protein
MVQPYTRRHQKIRKELARNWKEKSVERQEKRGLHVYSSAYEKNYDTRIKKSTSFVGNPKFTYITLCANMVQLVITVTRRTT